MLAMRRSVWSALFVVVATALPAGCSRLDPSQQDRLLENAPNPVGEARSMIEGYASGSPMGSEASIYDDLVARVTAADAAKGAALAAFVEDIRKSPGGLAAKAKAFLETF